MATPETATADAAKSPRIEETPFQRLDRLVHASTAPLTSGLSPVSLSLALADWAWHLAASPGRQLELAGLAMQLGLQSLQAAAPGAPADTAPAGDADDDPRFRHEAWANWPFNALRTGFRNTEAFWRDAARMPGMTAHHAEMTGFFAKQVLNLAGPANWLPTNPVVLQDVADSGGAHLVQGLQHWLRDASGQPDPAAAPRHRVGRDVAVTPGKVVYRNHLIELIRYDPQTPTVHPEPLLIVPSWIMKFYILDLSPHNSMVRFLVQQGHVVYLLSWRNPDAADQDLTMDDYLQHGVLDAMAALGRLQGSARPVHAMGYCLGGTLLAIAAAALARQADGPPGLPDAGALPPLASLTLLAAQTDFSEPGELGLFIDESQIGYLDDITRGPGYLSGGQMAGSFQFLHSRDLVWTRRMRQYLMGEREKPSDLMDWNADVTRMPARMHHEYLTALYLHNALATSQYRVADQAVSLADLRMPIFLVGTARDHISPWRSVYKLHHLCAAEISFVLASGGHNAGIIAEPGHAQRSYQIASRPARGAWVEAGEWARQAPQQAGSWWPAWAAWLGARSSARQAPAALPQRAVLGDAPGQYVLQP